MYVCGGFLQIFPTLEIQFVFIYNFTEFSTLQYSEHTHSHILFTIKLFIIQNNSIL